MTSIAALAALLVLVLVGWIASYPMVIGMNTFGVILGGITLFLLCVASVVVALYFAGQGKKGLGRVIPLPSIPTTVLASPLLSILMDFFGLIVWWFLTVACIWRFSFGVVAEKNTLGEDSRR
ncbi:MAG: hypothetical protein LBK67_06805 [Coriobacteriales bacterium]|jgi:hypothetical protein|nr:hypothetical protein [Coriobacteriales bacterium]